MLSTFKYTVLSLVRTPTMLVWAFAFPIILSTCFLFMFGGLSQNAQLDPIEVIVVEDENYRDATALDAYLDALAEDELIAVRTQPSYEDAERAVLQLAQGASAAGEGDALPEQLHDEASAPIAIISVTDEGVPALSVLDVSDASQFSSIKRDLLVELMDLFTSRAAMVSELLADNPALMRDAGSIEALFSIGDVTSKVQLTKNAPVEEVRYYYALLGMAALMAAQSALIAVLGLLPNMGALGARRSVAGISRARALVGTMLGSWMVSFAFLFAAYVYMRVVCGVDFGDRDLMSIVTLAVCALAATALGSAIAVIPKMQDGPKAGILTAVSCLCALFAGLYGEPTMQLADNVAAAFPASELVNPAVQISQAFYALMYYDSLAPCLMHLGVLLVMTLVLFAVSASALRRVRYASL